MKIFNIFSVEPYATNDNDNNNNNHIVVMNGTILEQ